MGRYILDSSGSGKRGVEGCLEDGNETSGSIKCWEFLEWLLKTDSMELLSAFTWNKMTTNRSHDNPVSDLRSLEYEAEMLSIRLLLSVERM
jgi:hypothetical protein